MSTVLDRAPVAAREEERALLAEIDRLLAGPVSRRPKLVGPEGEEVELPASALHLLHRLVHLLARGQAVTLVSVNKQLTTQQAADILNVSRPYLIQLLDRGEIPCSKTGSHRRVRFDDLMDYKRRRDAERGAGLCQLIRLNEELGLYEKEAALDGG